MKRLLLTLVVTLCSVFAWGQALSVVDIGNKCLTKNNFAAAKQVFYDNALYPAANETSTIYVVSLGEDSYTACMAAINASTNKTIKNVTFLIGEYYQDRLISDLKAYGYKYHSKQYVTLGNGARVPQTTYANGTKRCMIQTIDGGFKNIIFKRQSTSTVKRK